MSNFLIGNKLARTCLARFVCYEDDGTMDATRKYLGLIVSNNDPIERNGDYLEIVGGHEVSGTGYARIAIKVLTGSSAANFEFKDEPGITGMANTKILQFPQTGEATSSWGTITHIGLWDAATGGHLVAAAPLNSPVEISAGDVLEFPIDAITVSMNTLAGNIVFQNDASPLEFIFGSENTIEAHVTSYLALCNSSNTELSGGSYAREYFSLHVDPNTSDGVENITPIAFTRATGSWGTAAKFKIMTAATGGALIIGGNLSNSLAITSGIQPRFSIGSFKLRLGAANY